MPNFSGTGHDVVVCQVCERLVDTGKERVQWRPDITGNESAGNVCPTCLLNVCVSTPESDLEQILIDHAEHAEHGELGAALMARFGGQRAECQIDATTYKAQDCDGDCVVIDLHTPRGLVTIELAITIRGSK